MPVPVVCPDCTAKLKAPDKARGKALKCPKCGGRIAVPAEPAAAAPAKAAAKGPRRRKAAAGDGLDGDTGEFLAAFDLSRAEDHASEVCPKCGKEVSEEDVECPNCGADLLTGGKGKSQRRKAKFKDRGEDPRVFYKTAAGDAWTFLKKNVDVAVRLGVLTTFSLLIAGGCGLMIAYCAFTPPKLFWGLFAGVAALFPPGCLWVLQESVTELTFAEKNKFKRFRFDTLLCVSRSPRLVAWAASLWPFTLLDLLGFAAWQVMGLGPLSFWGALGLHAVAVILCWPAGLGHMAMPVPAPGWNFLVVGRGTARNLGPALFWAALTFAAFLPLLGVLGGVAAIAGSQTVDVVETLLDNGAATRATAVENEGVQGQKGTAAQEPVEWTALIVPAVAVAPLAFLFAFGAVYAARPAGLLARMFRPSLELVTLAREKKYVAKLKRKDELADLDEEPEGLDWQKVGLILGVTAILGLVGGFAYSMLGTNVDLLPALGTGLIYAASVSGGIAGVVLVVIAFKESVLWGLGCLFLPLVSLVFVALHWDQAKYAFIWNVGTGLLAVVGVILFVATGGEVAEVVPA